MDPSVYVKEVYPKDLWGQTTSLEAIYQPLSLSEQQIITLYNRDVQDNSTDVLYAFGTPYVGVEKCPAPQPEWTRDGVKVTSETFEDASKFKRPTFNANIPYAANKVNYGKTAFNITYYSSNTDVATVDVNGVITATGNPGTTNIRIYYTPRTVDSNHYEYVYSQSEEAVYTLTIQNTIANYLIADDMVAKVGASCYPKISSSAGSPQQIDHGSLYTDAACTQEAPSGTYSAAAATDLHINTAGTYYMKFYQNATGSYSYAETVVKFTIKNATAISLATNASDDIYRSKTYDLDVSTLFTSTSSKTITYSLNGEALASSVLTDDLPVGQYIIKASQEEDALNFAGEKEVKMHIVGEWDKEVIYEEAEGNGTFTYTVYDMAHNCPVEVPCTSESYLTCVGIGINNMEINGVAYNFSGQNETPSTNFRTVDIGDLKVVFPSTQHVNYYSYANDAASTFTVTYAMAAGNTYEVTSRMVSAGNFNDIRANITLKTIPYCKFWPVPADFSHTGGSVTGSITECPLTVGTATYGHEAKTITDRDYQPGTAATAGHTFTNATTVTATATVADGNLIPTAGTYYKFDPTRSKMLLTVGIALPKRKTLMIIDSDNAGNSTSMTSLGSGLQGWRDVNGTVTLEAEAGHSYYFYSPDAPLQIFGYEYSKAE